MANKKSHVTKEERFFIETCLKAGDSLRGIARRLKRGVSSISEEVSANGGRAQYDAKKAELRAYLKQYRKKQDCMKVALDPFLSKFVEEKLRKRWSPGRISGYLKKNGHPHASRKAIRKFAHSRRLDSYLYRRGKSLVPKASKHIEWQRDRIFIDDPRCVRDGYGHWEGDFIVSSKSTAVLLVLVERRTKDTVIRWLPDRRNVRVRRMIASALREKFVRSLTLDNDIAFAQHKELAEKIRASVYFARPYRSTDKALVENTNRWIRWFVPKKMNIADVSKEIVSEIEEWFNTVPRQCLGFASSREVVSLLKLQTGCSY
jgi:IS30 family transposase